MEKEEEGEGEGKGKEEEGTGHIFQDFEIWAHVLLLSSLLFHWRLPLFFPWTP